jgi:polysaccharide pyruvyl transferase WcaK-like protein
MTNTFQTGFNPSGEAVKIGPTGSFFRRPLRRLALVSPWGGGNLGNSAILSSVILNLSRRVPGIEFIGVTLSGEQTVRRFGIEAFPLTASICRYQYQWDSAGPDKRGKSARTRIKQWLKQIPVVSNFLRFLNTILREIRHILAASRLIRGLDCVLIAGGGALDELWGGSWGHPWNMLKWGVLSRIHGVPFLFISVGKSPLERSTSRLFVRIALKVANYRSYRDPDSKNGVQTLIHAPNDPVVPDLAFSYPLPLIQNRRTCTSSDERLVVGLSPIAYCDPRVWPLKDEQRYAQYLQQLAEIVKWILKEGHQLLFFATDSPDLEPIKDLFAAIADFPHDPGAILTLPGPVEQTIDGHLRGIARADLIVASRLHGVILSHLIALPVLAISFDPKVDSHMAGVKQTDYCLNIDTVTLDAFIEPFQALKSARRQEAKHLHSVVQAFREQVDAQFDEIFGFQIGLPNGRPSELSGSRVVTQNAALRLADE